jgi:hypothetical protein
MRVRHPGSRLGEVLERFYDLEQLQLRRGELAAGERRRATWPAWQAVIADLRTTPECLAVVCVYCTRLRLPDNTWRRPPAVLRAYLQRHQRLSHTYCADCLRGRGLS